MLVINSWIFKDHYLSMRIKRKRFKTADSVNETIKKLNPGLFNCFEGQDPAQIHLENKDELIDKVELNVRERHTFTYSTKDLLYQVL